MLRLSVPTHWCMYLFYGISILAVAPNALGGPPFQASSLSESPAPAERLEQVPPEEVGLAELRLAHIEDLVLAGIQEQLMPGCVIAIGRHGKIAYLEAFGNKQLVPHRQAMTTDTVFDMASITKPVATATSIMKLVEQGKIRLGTRVSELFPEFAANGKDKITVQDLLIHQSGLIPDNSLNDYAAGPDLAWERICELELVSPVGSTFKYSDVNFIVLAEVVKNVSGLNVHEFSQREIFQPLGMQKTGFLPSAELRQLAAPTQLRDGQWMQGEVHDPRAFALGGIAGHAGLFSTAEDLAVYAQMMLDGGKSHGVNQEFMQILAPQTIARMTRAYSVSDGIRGLGWDKQSGYSSNRGDLLSDAAFGHGGFTGTVMWIDPELELFFIFLSNRVHPNGKGSVNHLAGKILNVVASAVFDVKRTRAAANVEALCGIDVLERDGFRQLSRQRIGLITNQTGRNIQGKTSAQLLFESEDVELVALFSPEHGFEGNLDTASVADTADVATGLKVFSLYGATRKPTEEMLSNLDTLVFDIQDIGTRFYTYLSTMGEAMEAAAEFNKRFVVLDRPNPINGVDLAGPMLDLGAESFVGFHRLPVRHGMTMGELARLIKAESNIPVDLTVIPCEGWERDQFWEQTNLTWINPSPNMRSLTAALLYPGIGLLETTNISVGRGTDTPFEIIGAPWIDGRALAAALMERPVPGVIFMPIQFVPTSSKFAGEVCSGINIVIVDRSICLPTQLGLEIASRLRQIYPDQWDMKNFNRLLGNQRVFESVANNENREEILQRASAGVAEFKRLRQKFLLY